MLLFLNEKYEAIYWRSSMAHGVICVWVPANGQLQCPLGLGGEGVWYAAETPECIAYQCCPSPYSLKLISEAAARKYGAAHQNPKVPPANVLDAIRGDDIAWWRRLAYASERYASSVGECWMPKYRQDNAELQLMELWRRTLGPKSARNDEDFEWRLLKYFHNEHSSECPQSFVDEVVRRLEEAFYHVIMDPCDKYDAEAVTRLWKLTKVSPCAKLDTADKKHIQYKRDQLRAAQKRRESLRPTVSKSLHRTKGLSRAEELLELLEDEDFQFPTLKAEAISNALSALEEEIQYYSELIASSAEPRNSNVREMLARRLHLRRRLHEKLLNCGYTIASDGYSVMRQFVPISN